MTELGADDDLVITHGEPHLGNVMRDGDALALVDWDTAGLALPERDLSIIDGITDDDLATYAEASGRSVSRRALDFYRLRWDLADIAEYTRVLRVPHRETADAELSAQMLDYYIRRQSGWDAFLS